MNFLLSEEQRILQDRLGELIEATCPLRRVHEVLDGGVAFDKDLWAKLIDFGVAGMILPEAAGGLGLEMIDLALVSETLGAALAPVPFLGQALAGLAIARGGDADQRARWLPAIASGEILATVALAEEAVRWSSRAWTLSPRDGRLSGVKTLVPHGAEADLFVVGTANGGLCVVERGGGVTCERIDGADRTRPLDRVSFVDVRAHPLKGELDAAERLVDAACVLLAADAFGGARRCVAMSVDYAKLREQFGVPIGSFQGLKHQLAEMALAVEPGRGLFWYAAHAIDHLPEKAAHAAAQAKAHLCDGYLQAARDTVEAHGGIGFTWEHDAHLFLKRAMFDWAWMGDPRHHRLRAADLAGWSSGLRSDNQYTFSI